MAGEIKMDKKQPFCWKCASKIVSPTDLDDYSFTLIGCKENDKIKNYNDTEKMCPLINDSSEKGPEPNKVLIIINSGCAQLEYKPDNIEVEIRDYDVQDYDNVEIDEDGDEYQKMIFPAEENKIEFLASGDQCFPDKEEPMEYRNYYKHCGEEWDDVWSCQCNDECPKCGKEIEPYKSEDI